jgi:hypothetical protein
MTTKIGLRISADKTNYLSVSYADAGRIYFTFEDTERMLVRDFGFNERQAEMVVTVTLATGEVYFPKMERKPTRWSVKYGMDLVEWAVIIQVGDDFMFEDGYNLGEKSTSVRFPDHTTALTYLAGKWNVPCQSLIIEAVR